MIAMKKNMIWSLIVHKNAIKICSADLQASGLSHCILYFRFHKGKDTSAIPQPSAKHLVYVFPIFFRFHTCFL